MNTLRRLALEIVAQPNADTKAAMATGANLALPIGLEESIADARKLPGFGSRPELRAHNQLKPRSVHTPQGLAALIHSLAHIELNAINLAADIVWRFPGMPSAFYADWLSVMQEEAYHFALLRDHLATLGYSYGDFPAHQSLWEMAEKTKGDLLARLAVVPRTLEARGLDASPLVRARLAGAGDKAGAAIIDIILRDEIGHVGIGNRWYRTVCASFNVDPIATYAKMASKYQVPQQRGPFNLAARLDAGFTVEEMNWLQAQAVAARAEASAS